MDNKTIVEYTEENVDDYLKEIKENFHNCRKEMKWSRQKLADESKIDIGVIRRFEESGKITLANLLALAKTMNYLIDFKWLFAKRSPNRKSIKEKQ